MELQPSTEDRLAALEQAIQRQQSTDLEQQQLIEQLRQALAESIQQRAVVTKDYKGVARLANTLALSFVFVGYLSLSNVFKWSIPPWLAAPYLGGVAVCLLDKEQINSLTELMPLAKRG